MRSDHGVERAYSRSERAHSMGQKGGAITCAGYRCVAEKIRSSKQHEDRFSRERCSPVRKREVDVSYD